MIFPARNLHFYSNGLSMAMLNNQMVNHLQTATYFNGCLVSDWVHIRAFRGMDKFLETAGWKSQMGHGVT